MGWQWRKSFGFGGAKTTISNNGVGFSYGFAGLRFGRSPAGNFWVSITIPGTGISFIKYLRTKNNLASLPPVNSSPNVSNQSSIQKNTTQSVNQKLLEKMKRIKP